MVIVQRPSREEDRYGWLNNRCEKAKAANTITGGVSMKPDREKAAGKGKDKPKKPLAKKKIQKL